MNISGYIYDEAVESARAIRNPSDAELRDMARGDEVPNRYGIPVYHTRITARSVRETVSDVNYLPEKERSRYLSVIRDVKEYLRGKDLVVQTGWIGRNPSRRIPFIYAVTARYARLAFMLHRNLFPGEVEEPELKVIAIPEWPERRVYVDPVEHVTYILGTDYYGESKMSLLRLAMHLQREERNGLGLHAGSKVYRVSVDGRIVEKGALIFGLSGTGKTTITVSDHGLTYPEGVEILQDDINLWDVNTFGAGTERNFYVKTDNVTSQPELLRACVAEDAIVENVPVKDGNLDFDDVDFCPNGRAIINRRRIPHTGENIDLKKTDVIFFNTRRYDIPIAGKMVSPEQAATFFMLGESTKTSAGTMDRSEIGKPVRVVGFDPFIVDRPWKNGMHFREILRRNPHVEVYILNTGYVGGPDGVKIRPEDTFAMIRAILRERVEWKMDDNVGYLVPVEADGVDLRRFDPYAIYDRSHYARLMESLRRERMEHLKRFPEIDFFEL